jgi:hypothetical protein
MDPGADWRREPSASAEASAQLRARCPVRLPPPYYEFLECSNGGGGPLPVQPLWFELWKAKEVLPHNEGYRREEFYPDLFLIGSSGGGCLIAFALAGDSPNSVVSMDWYDSRRECVYHLGHDFLEFVKLLGHDNDPQTESILFGDLW